MVDYLIQNGMVVDGTGSAAFHADVAICGDKIVKVAPNIDMCAKTRIDATGRLITPGFIDSHRHADLAVFGDAYGETELRQGITTVIGGPCGLSLAPCDNFHAHEQHHYIQPITGVVPDEVVFERFSDYMDALDGRDLATNYGCLVGTNSCRIAIKGFSRDPLSEEEREVIALHIRDALDAGAAGISSGIAYVPENGNTPEDFDHILRYAKPYEPVHAVHLRGEGDSLVESVEEALTIGEHTGVITVVSHFKVVGKNHRGISMQQAAEHIEEARSRGRKVYFDMYPYEAGATLLLTLVIPPIFQDNGTEVVLEQLHDPIFRAQVTEALQHEGHGWDNLILNVGFDNLVISSVSNEHNQQYVGKSIAQVAQIQGKDPYEAAYDFIIDEEGLTTVLHFASSMSDVEWAATRSYGMFISDALYSSGGVPHPRLFSAFPKALRLFCMQKKLLSIEQGIHKMTGMPAEVYKFSGKGYIKEGMDADVLILDYDHLRDRGVYFDPQKLAVGFDYVFLNGKPVVKFDCYNGEKHGRLLRRKNSDCKNA